MFFSTFTKCAQVIPLSGGVKDITPPKIISIIPENYSTNFKSSKIIFEFDEFFQINNPKKAILFSPYIENFEHKINGKKLILYIEDTLHKNTTYSIYLNNKISDYNESNPIKDYYYIFSSNSFIDSGKIKGQIINTKDNLPVEDVTVLLYNKNDTLNPIQNKFEYISKTNKKGEFYFNYIKNGEYHIFGLLDKNTNNLFDLPNEQIAFQKALVTTKDSNNIKLRLFESDYLLQYIKINKNFLRYKKIHFNKPLKNIKIEGYIFENGEYISLDNHSFITSFDKNNSISIWIIPYKTKKEFAFILTDINFKDTIYFKSKLSDNIKKIKLNTNIKNKILPFFDYLIIECNYPIKKIDISKILIFENDSQVFIQQNNLSDNYKNGIISTNSKKINYKWNEYTKYLIQFLPGAIINYYDEQNDTININFNTSKSSDYGSFKIKLNEKIKDKQLIFQLIDSKDKNIEKEIFIKNQDTIYFQYLTPKKYTFQIIVDDNNDKKWTTGNFKSRILPELIITYDKSEIVNPNWDLEITWDFKIPK